MIDVLTTCLKGIFTFGAAIFLAGAFFGETFLAGAFLATTFFVAFLAATFLTAFFVVGFLDLMSDFFRFYLFMLLLPLISCLDRLSSAADVF